MELKRLTFAALLGLGVSAALAQDQGQESGGDEGGAYSPAFEQCMEASGGVTSEMLDCMATEMKLQDARLNNNYQALLKAIPAARQEQLRKVQRAWVTFRGANCDFYADPDGGSIVTVSVNGCLLEMTAIRADELASLLPPEQ